MAVLSHHPQPIGRQLRNQGVGYVGRLQLRTRRGIRQFQLEFGFGSIFGIGRLSICISGIRNDIGLPSVLNLLALVGLGGRRLRQRRGRRVRHSIVLPVTNVIGMDGVVLQPPGMVATGHPGGAIVQVVVRVDPVLAQLVELMLMAMPPMVIAMIVACNFRSSVVIYC